MVHGVHAIPVSLGQDRIKTGPDLQAPRVVRKGLYTGGVSLANLQDFLRLSNVPMVGGSWLTPLELVEAGNWAAITKLAREATELANAA
jgi:2-keto-3-deoxy-6-phosphogluconate aldolase